MRKAAEVFAAPISDQQLSKGDMKRTRRVQFQVASVSSFVVRDITAETYEDG